MKPIYWMLLIWGVLFFLVFLPEKRRKTAAAAHHIKRKGKKEREAMETLAKQFAGKECIIYTITSNDGSVQGTIREVSGGGLLIEDASGQLQAVNLEYVTRIREYPRSRKGKKKSVVLD